MTHLLEVLVEDVSVSCEAVRRTSPLCARRLSPRSSMLTTLADGPTPATAAEAEAVAPLCLAEPAEPATLPALPRFSSPSRPCRWSASPSRLAVAVAAPEAVPGLCPAAWPGAGLLAQQDCDRSSSQLVRALKMTSSLLTPSGSPTPSCTNRLLAASLLQRHDMAALRTGSVI